MIARTLHFGLPGEVGGVFFTSVAVYVNLSCSLSHDVFLGVCKSHHQP